MRILIATDSFPPGCGGSGWSTYELARGLRARGHDIVTVQPRPGHPSGRRDYDGFEVDEFGSPAPPVPFLRNYFKNEYLYARVAAYLRNLIHDRRPDVVHAQHVLSAPPAIAAARSSGVPVVCTVRDYWPVCYWSDLIHDFAADSLCPGCSAAMMTRCIRPRAGRLWPLALPFVPYMRSNLRLKRARLANANAVVAVSSAIASDLRSRAPELARARVVTIPNPVDLAEVRAAATAGPSPLDGPFAVFVGKLARNKGVLKLAGAMARAGLRWPLVIVGDGPLRPELERELQAGGTDARFTGWLPRADALSWLAHAALLVFPSHGPESLSRVLLEAASLGVPIAAMDTGGTRDIVIDEVTGLLSGAPEELGDDVARLAAHRPLAERLAAAARAHVERTFASEHVVGRIETLYGEVARGRRDG